MYYGKRLFDLVFSLTGLLLLSPLFLLIMLIVFSTEGTPIIFRQERIGFHGRVFFIFKFRTMVRCADWLGKPLTVGGDPRITRTGFWLRKFKLDELPQLVNVVMGDMSLVGPRPEVPRYVAMYSQEQRRVLDMKPGITDPASIAFRDEACLLAGYEDSERAYIERVMPEKIKLNLAYAAKAGFVADLAVVLGTFRVLWG